VGRIEVRGPSVMAGYLEDPAATARAVKQGWLDTGDLGAVVGGELYVCGREKEVVILRGANHAPQEFGDALSGLCGAREGWAVAERKCAASAQVHRAAARARGRKLARRLRQAAVPPMIWDVAICGGGPAGLATAIRTAESGYRTVLFERAAGTPDKACGEGLMPRGLAALTRLSVLAGIDRDAC